jgi:hypothetical protein
MALELWACKMCVDRGTGIQGKNTRFPLRICEKGSKGKIFMKIISRISFSLVRWQ